MTLKVKYSNNSGKAVNLFIRKNLYYMIKFNCPESNSLNPTPYHPKYQQVFYSEKAFKNSKLSNGLTIVFTPEDWQNGIINNIFHGCYIVKGFYDGEDLENCGNGRKTKNIEDNFNSEVIL